MAEELIIASTTDKQERYDTLVPQIEALVAGEKDVVANLSNIWCWIFSDLSRRTMRF